MHPRFVETPGLEHCWLVPHQGSFSRLLCTTLGSPDGTIAALTYIKQPRVSNQLGYRLTCLAWPHKVFYSVSIPSLSTCSGSGQQW
jgi:hypothetical protein